MSRDVYLYEIGTKPIKKKLIIHDDSESKYLFYSKDRLPRCLKKYAQKVMVRYQKTNWDEACIEHFGSERTSSKLCCWSERVVFYNGETELGSLTFEELAKYDYQEDKLTYVVPAKRFASPDYSYALSFDEGIYPAKEILAEMLRLIDSGCCQSYAELIEALALAYKRAGKGKKIFFEG